MHGNDDVHKMLNTLCMLLEESEAPQPRIIKMAATGERK